MREKYGIEPVPCKEGDNILITTWEKSGEFTKGEFKRNWLVQNVKGLGMKTATHLLRNLGGADDMVMIDTHILKYLKVKEKNWNYRELEKRFRKRAKRYGITMAELDTIVWKKYSGTDWKEFVH